MKIDGRPVPQPLVEVWRQSLGRATAPQLRQLAQECDLNGGYRPNKGDPAILLARIRTKFDTSEVLQGPCREFLRSTGLGRSLLRVLSEEAIHQTGALLSRFFGRDETLAAMLLDDRQAVRDQGFALQAVIGEGADADDAHQQAAEALAAELAPFLAHVRGLLADASPAKAVTLPADAQPLARSPRPATERSLVLRLRETRTELGRVRRELTRITIERNLAQARANAAEAGVQALTGERNALQTELGELQTQFDARAQARVAAMLDARLLPWLKPAEDLADATVALLADDALTRAQAVLQRQVAADKRHGLRSALREELVRCDLTLQNLRTAQTDSISPLPELATSLAEVAARAQELRAWLNGPAHDQPAEGPLIDPLRQRIAEADTLDELAAVRQSLRACEPLGLLDEGEFNAAYALLRDAASRIYARTCLGRGWTPGGAELSGLPLYALQSQLARDQACTLVVDGHNVLHKLPTLFRPDYEAGRPGPRARRALESRLVHLGRLHPMLTVHLWFDGHVMEDRPASANVRVHFSGGVGDNRADRQILAYLRHACVADAGAEVAVVTADGEVAANAQGLGAMVMAPQELAVWVG